MTAKVRCWCDVCGEEMPAERLHPVLTIERDPTASPALWAIEPQWRQSKLGDACATCLRNVRLQFRKAPVEIDPAVVDRILEGMDR